MTIHIMPLVQALWPLFEDGDPLELRAQRTALEHSLAQSTAAQAGLEQTTAWLRRLGSWTELLEHATQDEQRTIYRECMARITIDAAAGTLTVSWTSPIARLCGTASYTAALPAQPQIPVSTVALIRELYGVEPRPTAKHVLEQLRARGMMVSQRTIQRYAQTASVKRGRPSKTD